MRLYQECHWSVWLGSFLPGLSWQSDNKSANQWSIAWAAIYTTWWHHIPDHNSVPLISSHLHVVMSYGVAMMIGSPHLHHISSSMMASVAAHGPVSTEWHIIDSWWLSLQWSQQSVSPELHVPYSLRIISLGFRLYSVLIKVCRVNVTGLHPLL